MEVLLLLPRDDRQLWILPLWHILPTGNFHFNEKLEYLTDFLETKKMSSFLTASWSYFDWQRPDKELKIGHFQTLSSKVPMGEDVLTNGRPEDGIYFLGTNGEEPRSYNSYNDQWAEIWKVWYMDPFHLLKYIKRKTKTDI